MILALVAGVVLGVASKLTDYVAPSWVGNSLALWILVAFLVGRRARDVRTGALHGATALVVATASYYAYRVLVAQNISERWLVRASSFWMALALPSGAISGGVAAAGDRAAWALPAGAFAGETVLVLGRGGRALHAALAAVAAVVLGGVTRWNRRALLLAAAGSVTVVLTALGYRALLRS
ncbi:MAG TPA: DUF6518 family protein [Actinomycetota bacterium]|nr:DUF6518 family protein [Actinomycetota bacterium]